jgi:ABC-type cobalamin/Fe3+-siderophores transport system ATPase subunit
VIFGLNGSGKSRVLRAIAAAETHSRVVDVGDLIARLRHAWRSRDDIAALVEETQPLSIPEDYSAAIRDLVRREYSSVDWFAIDIEGSPVAEIVGEEVLPYFRVGYSGSTYGAIDMGSGELATHLLLWLLLYMRDSPPQTLLLDEPDAFMPAPVRIHLLDHLLEMAVGSQAQMVVASHSLEVIDPSLDAQAGLMLAETGNVVTCLSDGTQLRGMVAGIYGKAAQVGSLVICEDESAAALSQALIGACDPNLWRNATFLWCAGAGDVFKLWEHLPRPERPPEGLTTFLFLVDGDQQAQVERLIASGETAARWPLGLLPGDPDALFAEASEGSLEYLAPRLRRPVDELRGFLVSLRGRDPHNWVREVVAWSGVDRLATLRALAEAVALDPAKVSAMEATLRVEKEPPSTGAQPPTEA